VTTSEANLASLAATVLQPGFVGTTAPSWVRRWLGDGLGAVVLFARNVVDSEQVAALTKKVMENVVQLKVPLAVEVGTGPNWFDTK